MGTPARVVVLPQDTARLRVEELTLPDPGPTQVVVKQFASGICHSQLHQMPRPRQNPVVMGHESTGTVLATGGDVTHVKEGDMVMVSEGVRAARMFHKLFASKGIDAPFVAIARIKLQRCGVM